MKSTSIVRSALLTVGISLGAMGLANGGSIYLKIPNVTGTVTSSGFSGDIQLTAYSQSFTNHVSSNSGGAASGRPSCGAINISKLVDATSQDFLEYVTRGTVIKTVTVYFTTNHANASAITAPYSIVLTNVRVTSLSQGDTASDTAGLGITENISLVADKFQVTYTTQTADGATGNPETYGWDCVANTAT